MKVIQITTPWCMSCILMMSRIEDLKEELNFELETLDFEEDDVSEYDPGNILPVFIFMDEKNNEIKRLVGEVSERKLRKVFKTYEAI